jgi:LTXXQ motif family protein
LDALHRGPLRDQNSGRGQGDLRLPLFVVVPPAIEAQLKGMKTSLRLSADQEKLWGPFESAVKDGQNARLLDLQKEQSNNLSPMDRLTAKADRLTRSRANLKKIVEAAKPLYASLADEQKHKFITLGRMLVPERGSFVKEMRRLGTRKSDQHDAE